MKPFKYWKRQEVEETFGLIRLRKMPLLEEWKKVDITQIKTPEKQQVEELRQFLALHVMDWNEAELKFHFLGLFMRVVNFYSDKYSPFVERSLSVTIGGQTASGYIDFMVATGSQIPRAPYFCLHEYKPEEDSSNDASGQLLIAMVAAQQANQKTQENMPIYGSFIIGRNFYFMVLHQKEYVFTDVYPATQEDIFEVFAMLRKVKGYIEKVV